MAALSVRSKLLLRSAGKQMRAHFGSMTPPVYLNARLEEPLRPPYRDIREQLPELAGVIPPVEPLDALLRVDVDALTDE